MMKIFLKWYLKGVIFLSFIVLITILGDWDNFALSRLKIKIILPTIIGGGIILGLFFYFIEVKYIPWRKENLEKKILRLFNGKKVTDLITKRNLHGFDIYTEVQFNFKISENGSMMELINFHIPIDQIEDSPTRNKFSMEKSSCMGIDTYRIYQTNAWGLKLAKRKLDKAF